MNPTPQQSNKSRLFSIPNFPEDGYNAYGHTPLHILLGRRKEVYNHSGNKRFRLIIKHNTHKYMKCRTKTGKSNLVQKVYTDMKSYGFLFFKSDKSTKWYLISDRDAREKVSHALRDSVRDLLKSVRTKQRKMNKKDDILDTSTFLLQSVLKKNPSMKKKANQCFVPTTLCNNDIFQNNRENLRIIRTPEKRKGQRQKQRDSIVSLFDGLAHEIADAKQKQRDSIVSLFDGLAHEIADADDEGPSNSSFAELDLLRLSITDISMEDSGRLSTLSMTGGVTSDMFEML